MLCATLTYSPSSFIWGYNITHFRRFNNHQACKHSDLGLPQLQNCEKYISIPHALHSAGHKHSVSLSFWWLAGDFWHLWSSRKFLHLSFISTLFSLSMWEVVGQNSQFLMLNGIWLESDVRCWAGRVWSQLGRSHGRILKNGWSLLQTSKFRLLWEFPSRVAK